MTEGFTVRRPCSDSLMLPLILHLVVVVLQCIHFASEKSACRTKGTRRDAVSRPAFDFLPSENGLFVLPPFLSVFAYIL